MPIGSREAVHRAWRLHAEHIRHSLVTGFYQGWDLHPAQLPSRYAAVYSFFLESLDAASERLRNFVEKAAKFLRLFHRAPLEEIVDRVRKSIHCNPLSRRGAVAGSAQR